MTRGTIESTSGRLCCLYSVLRDLFIAGISVLLVLVAMSVRVIHCFITRPHRCMDRVLDYACLSTSTGDEMAR